ncbi:hypothetical protein ECO55CA74_25693 (plasmid) [Escherichia coli O55:H7 str. RM12579]|nr:hypothetical protein ECO55CA74_25693 [Escherichia coli O55:H7 str. RM12579]AXF39192.1 hypothetical protein [Punavirus P1]UVY04749.1 MAG: hypothetical protein [Bacteriophage sp.]UVY15794.1 MAG: hypothetical protein [Bacteriophage sp.]UVY17918.1 MAG: hypothetical protein [Bacteriophage sp.]
MSFGWLSTVDGETRRNEWTDITISPRALSRIHRNGKSILGGPVDWDMNPLQENALTCYVLRFVELTAGDRAAPGWTYFSVMLMPENQTVMVGAELRHRVVASPAKRALL